MNLPKPGPGYSQADEARTRGILELADKQTRKRGQDLELGPTERLIMVDQVTGLKGVLSIVSGVPTWTAL
jgi:hypothetical protein